MYDDFRDSNGPKYLKFKQPRVEMIHLEKLMTAESDSVILLVKGENVIVREWVKLTINKEIILHLQMVRCRGLIDSAFYYLPHVASSSPRGGTFNFRKCYILKEI